MKNIIIKNKIKVIISLILIVFLFLLLNTKNIYNLLKGNINNNQISQINDYAKTMETNTVLAEINADNGYFMFFDNDAEKPILSVEKDNELPNIYMIKIVAKFTANLTYDDNGVQKDISKQVKIRLAEGINLVNNGSEEIINQLKDKKIDSVVHTEKSVYDGLYDSKDKPITYKANDGVITYNFNPGVEQITFSIYISPNTVFDFSEIEDAITVELYENEGAPKDSCSVDISNDFSLIPIKENGSNNSWPGSIIYGTNDLNSYDMRDNLVGLDSWTSRARPVLYEYIDIVVRAPKKAQLVGTRKNGSSTSTGGFLYNATKAEVGYDFDAENNTSIEKIDCAGQNNSSYFTYCKDKADYNIYIFRTENVYTHFYGVIPVWKFPTTSIGEQIKIEGVNITYKTKGKSEVSRDFVDNYNIFTITNEPKISVRKTSSTISSYNSKYPNEEIMLGHFGFQNSSPIEAKNKEFVYTFVEQIGINNVVLPSFSNAFSEDISFKVRTYEEGKWITSDWQDPIHVECINDENNECSYIFDSGSYGFRYLLTKQTLGLKDNQYIAALKFNSDIPGYYQTMSEYWYYTYSGIILTPELIEEDKEEAITFKSILRIDSSEVSDETVCSKNENSLETCAIKDGESYSTNKVNSKTSYLKIFPFRAGKIEINAGNNAHFDFEIKESKDNAATSQRTVHNPIIYIRSETGMPVLKDSIKLINNDGIDLIKHYNLEIQSYSQDSTKDDKKECKKGEICIYKIDTSSIGDNSALVGYVGHRDLENLKILKLEFDIYFDLDYQDKEELHYFKDMIYVTSNDSNEQFNYLQTHLNGDPNDIDLDGKTNDDIMTRISNNYYYKVSSPKDLNSTILQKESDKDDYFQWTSSETDSHLSSEKYLDLELEVTNNTGYNFKEGIDNYAIIYMPIPKENENWGDLSNHLPFDLNLNLKEKIKFDESKFAIFYGKLKPTSSLGDLRAYDKWIGDENVKENEFSEYNIVKIVVKEFDKSARSKINIKLELDDKEFHEVKRDQLRYIVDKDFTAGDNRIKVIETGNFVGVTNELTKYNLTIVHKDIYDKILDTEIISKVYNEEYETSKKEFENYEIFLEAKNSKGVIKEDTVVTYVYKSTLDRKVIIHFYEKGTKNKLLEDKVLNGRDLEGFEIKPEIINGYKVVDGKEIKGSFKGEVQEFIYEYEKEIIVIPSTVDNITSNIIIFVISITLLIFVIYFVIKKKKLK